jgi:hypothetical protein
LTPQRIGSVAAGPSVAQPFDIRVRRGTGRPHRVNVALDRLRERLQEPGAAPTQLRLVLEARLPRGQARPVLLEYQRIATWMMDCRTSEAVTHARRELRALMNHWDRVSLPVPPLVRAIDPRAVPDGELLAELDRRGIVRVRVAENPDAILRREFGQRLRRKGQG